MTQLFTLCLLATFSHLVILQNKKKTKLFTLTVTERKKDTKQRIFFVKEELDNVYSNLQFVTV